MSRTTRDGNPMDSVSSPAKRSSAKRGSNGRPVASRTKASRKRRRVRPRAYVLLAVVIAVSIGLGLVLSGGLTRASRSFAVMSPHIQRRSSSSRPNLMDFQALVKRANHYYDTKNYRSAVPWYKKALDLNPDDTAVLVDLGTCYYYCDAPDRALSYYDRALKVDARNQSALYNKGIVLKVKGDYQTAARVWRVYLRTNPKAADAASVRTMISKLD